MCYWVESLTPARSPHERYHSQTQQNKNSWKLAVLIIGIVQKIIRWWTDICVNDVKTGFLTSDLSVDYIVISYFLNTSTSFIFIFRTQDHPWSHRLDQTPQTLPKTNRHSLNAAAMDYRSRLSASRKSNLHQVWYMGYWPGVRSRWLYIGPDMSGH